ncbi:hypothetical protein E9993_14785 [Labilibacter sediminis]|nr:hypothetical protein E9993_14785 [Labilibacter sediminis]
MLRIKHAEPKSSGYWLISYPHMGDPMFEKVSVRDEGLKQAVLVDPKTSKEIVVDIHDMWTVDASQGMGDAFSKLMYGLSGKKMMVHLQNRYPQWDGQLVEFILVKRHE